MHCYGDDTQVCLSFKPDSISSEDSAFSAIQSCISDSFLAPRQQVAYLGVIDKQLVGEGPRTNRRDTRFDGREGRIFRRDGIGFTRKIRGEFNKFLAYQTSLHY